jgi:hypothetical protein
MNREIRSSKPLLDRARGAWREYVRGFRNVPVIGPTIRRIGDLIRGVRDWFGRGRKDARNFGNAVPRHISEGIRSGAWRVRRGAKYTSDEAVEALKKRREDWNKAGALLVRGQAKGMVDEKSRLKKAASEGVRAAEQELERANPRFANEGRRISEGTARGIDERRQKVRDAGGAAAYEGAKAVGETRSNWHAGGMDVVSGLGRGVHDNRYAFLNVVADVARWGIGLAKRILGIRSPSSVFADIGKNVGDGLGEGIRSRVSKVVGSIRETVEAAVAAATGAGDEVEGAVGGGRTRGTPASRRASAPHPQRRPQPPVPWQRLRRSSGLWHLSDFNAAQRRDYRADMAARGRAVQATRTRRRSRAAARSMAEALTGWDLVADQGAEFRSAYRVGAAAPVLDARVAANRARAEANLAAAPPPVNIYTLHPGDPRTLAAVADAAAKGIDRQGARATTRRRIVA